MEDQVRRVRTVKLGNRIPSRTGQGAAGGPPRARLHAGPALRPGLRHRRGVPRPRAGRDRLPARGYLPGLPAGAAAGAGRVVRDLGYYAVRCRRTLVSVLGEVRGRTGAPLDRACRGRRSRPRWRWTTGSATRSCAAAVGGAPLRRAVLAGRRVGGGDLRAVPLLDAGGGDGGRMTGLIDPVRTEHGPEVRPGSFWARLDPTDRQALRARGSRRHPARRDAVPPGVGRARRLRGVQGGAAGRQQRGREGVRRLQRRRRVDHRPVRGRGPGRVPRPVGASAARHRRRARPRRGAARGPCHVPQPAGRQPAGRRGDDARDPRAPRSAAAGTRCGRPTIRSGSPTTCWSWRTGSASPAPGTRRASRSLSQAELANWAGISRETLVRWFRSWRAKGILHQRPRPLTVLDTEGCAAPRARGGRGRPAAGAEPDPRPSPRSAIAAREPVRLEPPGG